MDNKPFNRRSLFVVLALIGLTTVGLFFVRGGAVSPVQAMTDRAHDLSDTALSTMGSSAPATTLVVTSTADSGPGTLRWAMQSAVTSDTITFDPAVFPPSNPVTIALTSALPDLTQGHLTLDASNAGVILDGSGLPAGYYRAFVLASNGNVIRGFQIVNFPYDGILVMNANNSTIGGDRGIGSGPMGQGNLITFGASFTG